MKSYICNVLIALVWLVNGLFCKVLNLVPRHRQIVARILGDEYATLATRTIGVLEILMAIWILTRIQSRLCAITQIVIVAVMNILEFILVPDLLLFGRINIIIATFFILIILINEFSILKKPSLRR
ncbi:hypothetical protein GO495_05965 [Chitinophaga oryziterrae]|uniref:DoxX family protein n=1 Tax=Chitinophaga oryziterrae TaxID=1031224 RepID=A0A6N8J673_9BACT|nr:DoxX-like family protein [Chitinophaga oryziterrae]MVT40121.1 hypothetical protein [Chitinophaga oryziterrae]